jgi:hypothetical protein
MSTRRFLMRAPADQGGEEREVPEDQVKKWRALGAVVVREVQQPRERTWVDTAVDLIPAAAATVGGVLGGASGLPAFGIGAAPGAVIGASTLAAGGESLRQLLNRYRGVDAPATAADAATQIAKEGVMGAVGEGVGRWAITPAFNAVARGLMQSAVKPPYVDAMRAIKQGVEPEVVTTLLDEGVPVSPRGVRQLRAKIDAVNTQVNNEIANASGAVNPYRVTQRLGDTAREYVAQVNPDRALRDIGDVGNEFLQHPWMARTGLTPPQAQALKVGTYRRMGEKYGVASTAAIEAEKALARGLKEELEMLAPSVAPMNAREGRLIDALDAVARRAAVAGNRDPVGFAWTATAASKQPATFMAALIDRWPAAKSYIAKGLYNEAGKVSRVPAKTIEVAARALRSSLGTDTTPDEPSPSQPPMASRQAMPPGLGTLPEGQKVVFHEGPFAGQAWGMVNGQPVRVQ